jgi:hypothetical protein
MLFYGGHSLPKRLINLSARKETMNCEILDYNTQTDKQMDLLGRRQRPELSLGYLIKAKALHTAVAGCFAKINGNHHQSL